MIKTSAIIIRITNIAYQRVMCKGGYKFPTKNVKEMYAIERKGRIVHTTASVFLLLTLLSNFVVIQIYTNSPTFWCDYLQPKQRELLRTVTWQNKMTCGIDILHQQ